MNAPRGWLYELESTPMVEQIKMKSTSPKLNWQFKAGWGVPLAWLTLCVVWSSTWLVIKIGLRDLPPISYAGIRFLIAIIVLFAVSAGRVGLVTAARVRLPSPGFYWRFDVCRKLRSPFWGELHVSSGLQRVAGDYPDLRDALRASNASRTNHCNCTNF